MSGDAEPGVRAYVLSAEERAVYAGLPAGHRREALAKCRRMALKAPELRDYYEAHAAYIEQLLVAASHGSTDGREALRVRLADAALHARVPTAPAWGDLDEYVHDVWLGVVEGVVDEVLAYGREQATRAAEQALRDAADDAEQNGEPLIAAWCNGYADAARADELGPQT